MFLAKQKNKLSSGPKYLIWAFSMKKQVSSLNFHPQICQNSKFHAKQKTENLGPKMPYLVVLE